MSVTKARNVSGPIEQERSARRGRPSAEDWALRARFVLRHLDDPIALEESSTGRLVSVERLARDRHPHGILPAGRTLRELALECLEEIEEELGGHPGVAKLRAFVGFTRSGMGVTQASKKLGISPEYASRALKRRLVELLAEKLAAKLR